MPPYSLEVSQLEGPGGERSVGHEDETIDRNVTIFGAAWNNLGLDDLARFLGDAEPEPPLWEAKGVEANPGTVRKQVCGFANSHEGGYLIIGASQADDGSNSSCRGLCAMWPQGLSSQLGCDLTSRPAHGASSSRGLLSPTIVLYMAAICAGLIGLPKVAAGLYLALAIRGVPLIESRRRSLRSSEAT
jgi:hypothetical protein